MIVSSITDREESRNLDGFRNILIGAIATSIDALAAGISLSMDNDSFDDMALKAVSVLVVTFVSVMLGIKGGILAGRRYGRPALLVGGIVLVVIGLNILFKFI
jgi:putative Mn2+ efflux pump MntP